MRVRRKAFSSLQKAIKREQGGELGDTRGAVGSFFLLMAWNLSLLCMYACVFIWWGEKIMGLHVHGVGQ